MCEQSGDDLFMGRTLTLTSRGERMQASGLVERAVRRDA